MSYKGIRFLGFLSILLMALLVGTSLWEMLGGDSSSQPTVTNQYMWMAFMFIGLLAERVGSILEVQADQIAHLKRQLEEKASTAA